MEGTEEMDSQSCAMQAPVVEIRVPAKLEEHHLNEESTIKAATKGRAQSCWKLTGKVESLTSWPWRWHYSLGEELIDGS